MATTEQVREAFKQTSVWFPVGIKAEDVFDAWLAEYRNSVIQEVHDRVKLIPCYGKRGGPVEFDIGEDARGQVLEAILELKGES
jgi:hypothetical protein